jgi:hypothetical protein
LLYHHWRAGAGVAGAGVSVFDDLLLNAIAIVHVVTVFRINLISAILVPIDTNVVLVRWASHTRSHLMRMEIRHLGVCVFVGLYLPYRPDEFYIALR